MRGREFALLDRRIAWGEERVYFRDDGGAIKRMPASWTSLGAVDPFVAIAAGRSSLRVQDLLQLVAIVERLGKTPRSRRSSRSGAPVSMK